MPIMHQPANDPLANIKKADALDAAVRLSAIEHSDSAAAECGKQLADVLHLRRAAGHKDRWFTTWGTKTDAGLARTALRILLDTPNMKPPGPVLKIQLRHVYGSPTLYPVNEAAQTLADIAGTVTLRPADLVKAKRSLNATVLVDESAAAEVAKLLGGV